MTLPANSFVKRVGLLSVSLCVLTHAGPTRADDSAAAQALFDQAKSLMSAHKFTDACPKLEESQRLDPALGTLLNLADCYEKEGKFATAWSKFLELAAKAKAAGQTERAQIGRERAAALAPRLSHLLISVSAADTTPDLQIKRDGTVVGRAQWDTPIPADRGAHSIVASASGRRPWSTSVDVGELAATSTVTIPVLSPAPVAAPTPAPALRDEAPLTPARSSASEESHGLGTQRILALVAGGVGVIGIGLGSYFGITSISNHNEAAQRCDTPVCSGPNAKRALELWSGARSAGDLSDLAFAVGGAALAGAGVLWFTGMPAEASSPTPQIGLRLGTVRVSGSW